MKRAVVSPTSPAPPLAPAPRRESDDWKDASPTPGRGRASVSTVDSDERRDKSEPSDVDTRANDKKKKRNSAGEISTDDGKDKQAVRLDKKGSRVSFDSNA